MALRTLFLLASLLAATPAAAQTPVRIWHALSGSSKTALDTMAVAFNRAHPEYAVQPVAMAGSPVILSKMADEMRRHRPENPVLAILGEAATGDVATAEGLVYPVSTLLRDMAEPYDPNAFMPAVLASYGDGTDGLLALPFLMTTPVLYYDAKAVKAAGFDPAKDLKTWTGFERVAAKMSSDRGGTCAVAMDSPAWIGVDNLMAMHDRPFASFDNGRGGQDARLALDVPIAARQLARFADMARSGAFRPRSAGIDAVGAFMGQACPLLLGTSGLLAHIRGRAGFEVGVLPLPFIEEIVNPPKPTLPGGYAMFAFRGRPPAENKGAAQFAAFLASADAQAWLARELRSIPSTFAGWKRAQEEGTTAAEPGLAVAAAELAGQMPSAASKSPRLARKAEIAGYFDTAYDQVFQGLRQPQAALTDAILKSDLLLREQAGALR